MKQRLLSRSTRRRLETRRIVVERGGKKKRKKGEDEDEDENEDEMD